MIKQLVATIVGSTLIASASVLGVTGLASQLATHTESSSTTKDPLDVRVVDPFVPTQKAVEEKTEAIEIAEDEDPADEVSVTEEAIGTTPKVIKTADDVAKRPDETIFRTMATQNGVTWGLDNIDGTTDGTYNYISDGTGVRIYIVDTGVDASHPDFGGRVVDGFDSFGQNLDQTDCNGHGTHVAAISAGSYFGVAKNATIVPVRVMDCNGVGNTSTLTDGINWILASHSGGTGIVNMSIGGEKDSEVDAVTERLVTAGLIVVAAAGNSSGDACSFSPASAPGVIAVAAIDRYGSRASFSNYGSCVDISAPGVGINSANAANYSISKKMSGTSQASPFVAGAIATYLSKGSASNPSAAEALMDDLSENGVVRVQVEPEPSEEPSPEPTVGPEPELIEPEPSPSPVVDEPIVTEPVSDVDGVVVIQTAEGSNVGTLKWGSVEGADGYRVYKTGSIRPGWRLYWIAENDWFERTIVDKVGSIAVYKVVALVGGKEVEVGEFTYEPR